MQIPADKSLFTRETFADNVSVPEAEILRILDRNEQRVQKHIEDVARDERK